MVMHGDNSTACYLTQVAALSWKSKRVVAKVEVTTPTTEAKHTMDAQIVDIFFPCDDILKELHLVVTANPWNSS